MNTSLLKYIGGAIVLLLIVAVVGKKTGLIGGKKGTEVAVEKAERRTITEIITANGKIEPETEVKISPDVSGEITELLIQEGESVKEGQLLLKIKPDIYQSALERAHASLNSAKSNMANSKARLAQVKAQFKQKQLAFERSKTLYDQKTISEADYETALAGFEVAKAEVEASEQSAKAAEFQSLSAEATVREANENLRRTTIYAPMDGTISRLNVEKGERVVGTVQMAGTEMLRIANLDRMQLKVEVNENDILKVSLKDTAVIIIDAYMDKEFKGVVTEIANSANLVGTSADQVTNFEVKILLLPSSYQELLKEGKPFPFRPGMSATADIRTDTRRNIITVPIQAVTTRPDSSSVKHQKAATGTENEKEELKEVVFVVEENKAILKYITTGVQDNQYIEVKEGIQDSMQVITAPYRTISKKLRDKQDVVVVGKEKLFKK